MKKENSKVIIIILVALIPFLILFWGSIFGSETDFINQHIVFPEYFRTLFYETKNFFPSFAFNIGGGQNIYNFSYYGFLNPVILLSYLFPFLDMGIYIIIISFISIILTSFLIFKWLRQNNVDFNLSLTGAIISLYVCPFIFHFHRHIMFVNYLPFLILALIGTDKFFKEGKKTLLTFSVFMIIMMSYYYSVGSIVTLGIYFIYKYLKIKKEFKIKDFLISLGKYIIPFIIAILMSGVLIIPTFHVLLNGRTLGDEINFLELITPNFNPETLFYTAYGLGFTGISLIAIILNNLYKKKEEIFLSVTFLLIIIFPIFMYLLNGTLYIRPKSLIPLFPLLVLLIICFLNNFFKENFIIKIS